MVEIGFTAAQGRLHPLVAAGEAEGALGFLPDPACQDGIFRGLKHLQGLLLAGVDHLHPDQGKRHDRDNQTETKHCCRAEASFLP